MAAPVKKSNDYGVLCWLADHRSALRIPVFRPEVALIHSSSTGKRIIVNSRFRNEPEKPGGPSNSLLGVFPQGVKAVNTQVTKLLPGGQCLGFDLPKSLMKFVDRRP